jgi:choline-sulfatase
MIAAPGLPPGRIAAPVSTMDVVPTLAAIAGIDLGAVMPWTDGVDLGPVARGGARPGSVAMEYAAEATIAPMVALRRGRWKYIACPADPELLFDLEADPQEMHDLASDPAAQEVLAAFRAEAAARWDMAAFDRAVRESQARRIAVYAALRNGAYFPWDFQPLQKASERYMRNHMDLNVLETAQRYPRGE